MTNKAQIEAELRGETIIPQNETGVVTRFIGLDDETVAKTLKNGALAFVAEYGNTTVASLLERRARALGLRNPTKRIPTITRLANLSDADFGALPKASVAFLADLLGITVDQLTSRRAAQRVVLGLTPKAVKVKAEKAPKTTTGKGKGKGKAKAPVVEATTTGFGDGHAVGEAAPDPMMGDAEFAELAADLGQTEALDGTAANPFANIGERAKPSAKAAQRKVRGQKGEVVNPTE